MVAAQHIIFCLENVWLLLTDLLGMMALIIPPFHQGFFGNCFARGMAG